jgi:hypothetical protein
MGAGAVTQPATNKKSTTIAVLFNEKCLLKFML